MLAGRSIVELNQYTQTFLYLEGTPIASNRQGVEIEKKIDKLIDDIREKFE